MQTKVFSENNGESICISNDNKHPFKDGNVKEYTWNEYCQLINSLNSDIKLPEDYSFGNNKITICTVRIKKVNTFPNIISHFELYVNGNLKHCYDSALTNTSLCLLRYINKNL